MNKPIAHKIEPHYKNQFGWLAGYLPPNPQALHNWHLDLKEKVRLAQANGELGANSLLDDLDGLKALGPGRGAVMDFAILILMDGIVRMYVEKMIAEVPAEHKVIENRWDLIWALLYISKNAPEYNADPSNRNFFPMSSLFVYMMMTPSGEAAFRHPLINGALRAILIEWCGYLNSPASQSVLNTGPNGWLSPSAYEYNKLNEFVIPNQAAPHWGWQSFNDYFHREIKPEVRPIAGIGDPSVIVSANDGTVYKCASNVQWQEDFWIKGQPYSLSNMLAGQKDLLQFVGGDVFQSFLSGADYHRWHAPIDGIVTYTEIVPGLMFSDAEVAGNDPTAGTYSQGYGASVNTRGIVFIQSPNPTIGTVVVMPIGITEISSVTITAQKNQPVKKGDELGFFSYGGSSMCLIFQPGAINHFTVNCPPPGSPPDGGPPINVNAQIAVANVN